MFGGGRDGSGIRAPSGGQDMRRRWPRTTVPLLVALIAAWGAAEATRPPAGEPQSRQAVAAGAAAGQGSASTRAARETGGPAGLPKPDPDTPEPTAEPGTALYHAQLCARYLGPIPAMSCSESQVVPVTVDGIEVSEEPETCDRPAALTGDCQLGNAIGRWQGTHHDGRPRPEVIFMNFCRDGGMGVIGHNTLSGATCFFHMSHNVRNTEMHPGSDHPDYEAYWQTPDIVAADQCQACHQADPFIHSPWADQLRHPDNPAETLVPVLAGPTNPRPPYFVVGDEFSQPITVELPGNRCTTCHRPSCDNRFAMPLADLAMPAPFDKYHSTDTFAEDRQAVRDWCDTIRSR